MDEINITEPKQKPRHTRSILGVGIVVIFVTFLTIYYQLLSPKNANQKNELQPGKDFTAFLSKQVNEQQKNDETIPAEIHSFLGKWQGEWALANNQKLPTALVVSEVVLGKGITVSYASGENVSAKAISVDGTTTGTVVILQKDGNPLALEFTFPQFENTNPVQFHFWFADATSQNLVGEFIRPDTGETVQGTFKKLDVTVHN